MSAPILECADLSALFLSIVNQDADKSPLSETRRASALIELLFLAQAFTPGARKAVIFKSPI